MTLDFWLLTLDSWILTIVIDSWLWTQKISLLTLDCLLLSLCSLFICNLLSMKFKRYCLSGFLKYFDAFVFKEVQLVQTPRKFFLWTRLCFGKRKPSVWYLCVCIKVCQRHLKLDFYAGVQNPKHQNDHPNVIFAFSDGLLWLCIIFFNLLF